MNKEQNSARFEAKPNQKPLISPEAAKKVKELQDSFGVMAEMAHILYTSMIGCGANAQEATAGMSAWIAAYWHEVANLAKPPQEATDDN